MDTSPEPRGGHEPIEPTLDRASEFMELYSANYQRVQFFLMSLMPTADDAADVLQETSVVLWKKFDSFEPGSDFFAWACTIARLQSLKHWQRNQRAARVLDEDVAELIAADASRDTRSFAGARAALSECLEELPDDYRKMVLDRYRPGASVMEMASERSWTANRLSKSLARIRQALLTCIQRKMAIESRG